MKLFELYAELGLDSSKFDQGIKKASNSGGSLASMLKSGLGGASNFVGKQVSATTVMLGNLMADVARKGVNLVKQTATAGIQYNSSMETYVTNFATMLGGSSEAAKQLTADLEDMAASTPFAMSELAGATNTLLAFGQDSETVLTTLENLGDISMGDANKLKSLTLAFAQASSSGKLMGQDLMQMVNAGFNPLQTIAEKTGASMGDLKEFMSSGKASADLKKQMREAKREVKALGDNASDGAKMLVQMSKDGAISADLLGQIFELETSPGGRFYNAMKNASETFEGMVSTLQDDSNALLGKVFKPLSDWMTADLLPNAIKAVGEISAAFDEGGLEGAVSKAVEVAGGYFSQLGTKAADAGANLLANMLTGLTGDTVSGPEISALVDQVWTDCEAGAKTLISTGGGLLKGIWDGLTGDTENKTNIITELSGMWDGASSTLTTFTNAAGGLLGTIWEKITGEEATAEKIGEKIGGLFKAGTDAIDELIDSATNLISDVDKALNGDKEAQDRLKKRGANVLGLSEEETDAWAEVGGFVGGKVKQTLTPVADYLEESAAEADQTPVKNGKFATGNAFWDEYLNNTMLYRADSNYATVSPADVGNGWGQLGIALRDWLIPQETPTRATGEQTAWGATGYNSGWEPGQYTAQRQKGTPFSTEGKISTEEIGALTAAVNALTTAAASLAGTAASAAASAISGAKVEMDGAAVGRIVLPTVSAALARGGRMQQKAWTGE